MLPFLPFLLFFTFAYSIIMHFLILFLVWHTRILIFSHVTLKYRTISYYLPKNTYKIKVNARAQQCVKAFSPTLNPLTSGQNKYILLFDISNKAQHAFPRTHSHIHFQPLGLSHFRAFLHITALQMPLKSSSYKF